MARQVSSIRRCSFGFQPPAWSTATRAQHHAPVLEAAACKPTDFACNDAYNSNRNKLLYSGTIDVLANSRRETHTAASTSRAIASQLKDGGRAFTSSAASLLSSSGSQPFLGSKTEKEKRLSRMLYRSRQRGFLELDLVVGKWAEANLARLSDRQLDAFEAVLDEENPDLWKALSGQADVPDSLRENEAFAELKDHVGKYLREFSPENTRAQRGAEWVRGWDDHKRNLASVGPSGLPPAGNQ